MNKQELLVVVLNDIHTGEKSNYDVYNDLQLLGDILDTINDEGYAEGIDVRRGERSGLVQFTYTEQAKVTSLGLDWLERHKIDPL